MPIPDKRTAIVAKLLSEAGWLANWAKNFPENRRDRYERATTALRACAQHIRELDPADARIRFLETIPLHEIASASLGGWKLAGARSPAEHFARIVDFYLDKRAIAFPTCPGRPANPRRHPPTRSRG